MRSNIGAIRSGMKMSENGLKIWLKMVDGIHFKMVGGINFKMVGGINLDR